MEVSKDNCVTCGKHRSELSEVPWWHPDGIMCKDCNQAEVDKQIIEFQANDPDTSYTDLITCPHCGHKINDSWEISADSGDLECGHCSNNFEYERQIDIKYSTVKK